MLFYFSAHRAPTLKVMNPLAVITSFICYVFGDTEDDHGDDQFIIIFIIFILLLLIIIIILMCQVCCRHRRSEHSNPVCRQFYWLAHCWEIFFLVTKLFRLSVYFVRRLFLSLSYHKSIYSIFAFPDRQLCLYAQQIVVVFFLMVLSRHLLYPAISITSLFGFLSVHDILIILLMDYISAASSLYFRSVDNGNKKETDGEKVFISLAFLVISARLNESNCFKYVDSSVC